MTSTNQDSYVYADLVRLAEKTRKQ